MPPTTHGTGQKVLGWVGLNNNNAKPTVNSKQSQWTVYPRLPDYDGTEQCRYVLPSVLWRCWLGGRKGTRAVKNWVVGCWHGYLFGVRCRVVYHRADAMPLTVTCFSKIQIGFNFWYWPTWVVLEKGPLNVCVCACVRACVRACVHACVRVCVCQQCICHNRQQTVRWLRSNHSANLSCC